MIMSYVGMDIDDLRRMLSVFSEHFGDKPMTEGDVTLRQKLEVMLKAETDWQKD